MAFEVTVTANSWSAAIRHCVAGIVFESRLRPSMQASDRTNLASHGKYEKSSATITLQAKFCLELPRQGYSLRKEHLELVHLILGCC